MVANPQCRTIIPKCGVNRPTLFRLSNLENHVLSALGPNRGNTALMKRSEFATIAHSDPDEAFG